MVVVVVVEVMVVVVVEVTVDWRSVARRSLPKAYEASKLERN